MDPISSAHAAQFSQDQVTPADVTLKRAEQELRITWRDGASSVFPAVTLRKNCPCATCRTEREKQSQVLLPILKQDPGRAIAMVSAQLVGNYALQLFWSDGHSTGIYDYRYLRSLSASPP